MTPVMEAHVTHYTGGCSCGKVRYEIAAAPIRGFQCQCRDCQRDTGSGHASVLVFPRAALGVMGRDRDIADSGLRRTETERILRVLRLAALQQAAIQAGHARRLCRHARRSLRLQARVGDVRIPRARLGSSGSGAAQTPEHAAVKIVPSTRGWSYPPRVIVENSDETELRPLALGKFGDSLADDDVLEVVGLLMVGECCFAGEAL